MNRKNVDWKLKVITKEKLYELSCLHGFIKRVISGFFSSLETMLEEYIYFRKKDTLQMKKKICVVI